MLHTYSDKPLFGDSGKKEEDNLNEERLGGEIRLRTGKHDELELSSEEDDNYSSYTDLVKGKRSSEA